MMASEIPPSSSGRAGDVEAAASEGLASQSEKWTRFAERISKAFGLVLLLVVATYVVASLTRYTGWSAVAILALATASAVVALVSAGVKAATVSWAIGLAVGSVVLAAVAALSGRAGFLAIGSFIEMVLLIWAVAAVLRDVLSESEVGFRTILGAISVYMTFGLLFTSLYVAIDRLHAGPFFSTERTLRTGDFIFFSFTT